MVKISVSQYKKILAKQNKKDKPVKKKAVIPKSESLLESHFLSILTNHKITGFVREYQAVPGRKFRVDFCNPDLKIAVEIEGGIFRKGRHTTGTGYLQDTIKYNLLVTLGYRLLRYCTKEQMNDFIEHYRLLSNG